MIRLWNYYFFSYTWIPDSAFYHLYSFVGETMERFSFFFVHCLSNKHCKHCCWFLVCVYTFSMSCSNYFELNIEQQENINSVHFNSMYLYRADKSSLCTLFHKNKQMKIIPIYLFWEHVKLSCVEFFHIAKIPETTWNALFESKFEFDTDIVIAPI